MKKSTFWALPRLCLCLIICFLWCSCAVLRNGKEIITPIKSYVLTLSMQPGGDEGNLTGLLTDAGLMPEMIARQENGNIAGTPEYLRVRIHIRDESQFTMLASRLRTSSIAIQNLQIESE